MPAHRHLPLPFPSTVAPLVAVALWVGAATGCGGEPAARDTAPGVTEAAADEGVLLDREGRLEAGDLQLGPGFSDHYEVAVRAGDRVSVEVRSTELDPLLEVTPPGGEPLVNDDWQGDRQRARVELVAEREGIVKVRVTSYAPGATGSYTVRAERTPAPTDPSSVAAAAEQVQELEPGGSMEGRLGPGDARLADGAFYDRLVVDVPAEGSLELRVTTGGATPRVEVMNPDGRALAETSPGVFSLVEPGIHRILVAGPGPDAEMAYAAQLRRAERATPRLARDHHQLPTQGGSSRIEMDRPVDGSLAEGDRTLPTGELADIYSLAGRAGSAISVEMTSEAVDPYLILIGPDGRHWENDDAGGSLNAGLTVTLPADGTYRVVATSYRTGESGGYRLKASREQRAVRDQAATTGTPSSPAAPPPQATGTRTATGSLAPGDTRLGSGEFVDEHVFEWPAGRHVRLEARSGDFDTYLMVRGPGGFQEDNDDPQPGNTNAAIDLVTPTAGAYRVLVTSYRPGEQGGYELRVGDEAGGTAGAGQAAGTGDAATTRPGQELRGELAAGDARLQSGEHVDSNSLRFEPGRPVRIRLESSDFDPYLIVRTPGGRQIDNDDLEPGNVSAGVDLPRAESGEYVVMVTSYSPGETGAWVLRVEEGPAVATPTLVDGGGSTGSTGGGRVFGVFAGITDYPEGVGDLPECANDAIKLAQTLREGGLLTEDRQVLLTDGQVTRANLRAAMARMAERVGPDDVFVFFYSGHGGRAEGRPTSDSREIDGADEYLYLHDGELLDDEMGRMFDGISARMSMVALDACFSGGFAKDVITRPGRVGLFSSEEDVTSAVAGVFQAGGYLSHFLRMGVAGEADLAPRDSVLTVGELTHYLTLQFGRHVRDVRMSEGYQHLVVDRGAVGSDDVMWAYR